jgi:hypothetical protein
MPDVTVEIEVYCAECGAGLCNQTEVTRTRQRSSDCFRVTPCEVCLKAAEQRGRDEAESEVD